MKTFSELLKETKQQITEVTPEQVKEKIQGREPVSILDVREKDEVSQGYIENALHIPRGFLEIKVETALPERENPVIVYCAGGTRSAMAARTLREMGYTNVSSMSGGFTKWREAGYHFVKDEAFSFTPDQQARYSRQVLLPEVGEKGQIKLLKSKVLMIGAGGLGSPAAYYLAAAGVGTLGIIDADVVDSTNLQRQILHSTERIGRSKVDSARQTIEALNPDVKVVGYKERLTSANIDRIIADYDVIVDGADNFPTRYLLNDASVKWRKPVVHGSIYRFEGQVTVFKPFEGPCYRCLFHEPPPPELAPSCAEAGVLGVLPGVIGTIQATEAIKLIMGIGEPLIGRFLIYDALRMKFRELKLKKDPDCPVCGTNPTVTELIDYEQFCGVVPAATEVAVSTANTNETETDVKELKRKIDAKEDFFLLDVREPNEYQIGKIPGSTLIPLGEVPQRVGEIPRDKEIVVHCKMGGRSAKAAAYLRQQGYSNVKNLKGGILDWSDKIDPSVPKY